MRTYRAQQYCNVVAYSSQLSLIITNYHFAKGRRSCIKKSKKRFVVIILTFVRSVMWFNTMEGCYGTFPVRAAKGLKLLHPFDEHFDLCAHTAPPQLAPRINMLLFFFSYFSSFSPIYPSFLIILLLFLILECTIPSYWKSTSLRGMICGTVASASSSKQR